MTATITTPTVSIAVEVARNAIMAREEYLRAEGAWKDAETETLAAFIDESITTLTIPNRTGGIDRVTAEGLTEVRRTVDMEQALALLNADQLAGVVSNAIAISAIDAAVATGLIPQAVAAQIIKTKQVKPSIKITFNAKESK